MYDYTTEQQLIFDEILSPTSPIVAIKAVAGANLNYLSLYLGKLEYNFS